MEVEEGTGAVAVKFDDLLTVTGSLERSSGFLLIHSSCADSLGLAALYGDATDCPKSKGSKSLSGFSSSSSSLVPSNELLKKCKQCQKLDHSVFLTKRTRSCAK